MTILSPSIEPVRPAAAVSSAEDLAGLRAELDALDDRLHDLLMQRAAIVQRVGASKGAASGRNAGRPALRAGREAAIIRRLLRRHTGALPRHAVVRLWRELLAATTAMQGSFVITACEAGPSHGAQDGAYARLAREHFGALTPLQVHRSAAQAIGEVSRGKAAVAVLPVPLEDEPAGAVWWTALLHHDEPRIHVVARLPFWSPRPEGVPEIQAFVVSAVAPDPSGADRTLIGVEIAAELSRTRLNAALTQAGLTPGRIILRRQPGTPYALALIDVDGFVAEGDARLSAIGPVLLRPPVLLGAYGVPIDG